MSTKVRRICLHGGAGSGKSRTAAWLYSQLKVECPHLEVQLVHEWVKQWATEGRKIQSFDQAVIFANQLHLEESRLRAGVDLLVTDAPLGLMMAYAQRDKCLYWPELRVLTYQFEEQYPAFNVFLDRGSIGYQEKGRYETLQQAKAFDQLALSVLADYDLKYLLCPTENTDNLLRAVLARLQVVS